MAINLNKAVIEKRSKGLVSPRIDQIQGFCLHKATDFETRREYGRYGNGFLLLVAIGKPRKAHWAEPINDPLDELFCLDLMGYKPAKRRGRHTVRQRHNQSGYGSPTVTFRKHIDPSLNRPRVQFGSGPENGLKSWKGREKQSPILAQTRATPRMVCGSIP